MGFLTTACSSSRYLNLEADRRASIINASLPYRLGSINIVDSDSEGATVNIDMSAPLILIFRTCIDFYNAAWFHSVKMKLFMMDSVTD